jgi:hypothetical protein
MTPQVSKELQTAHDLLNKDTTGQLAGFLTKSLGLNVPSTSPNLVNVTQQATMRDLLRIGALTAALGVGYRGALGLRRVLSPDSEVQTPEAPSVVRIPIRRKQAALEAYNPEAPGGVVPFLKGQQGTTMLSKPWAIAALPFVIGGGLYGGYKLSDILFDKLRKSNTQQELDEAKKQYQEALLGRDKEAGDQAISAKVDKLFDTVWEKRAILDKATGGYLAALLAAGGLAAYAGHSLGSKYNKSNLLQKALERRKAMLAARSPAPVTVLVDESPSEDSSI